MSANTSPIFTGKPSVQWIGPVLTANTTKDLTAGTIYLIFTADATNGGRVDFLRITPIGSCIATVLRLWINNGATTGTATNQIMYDAMTLPAVTLSEAADFGALVWPIDLVLPISYRLYATVGTGVATGYHLTAVGGAYTL